MGLLVYLSVGQLPRFSSSEALWRSAHEAEPQLARPAINLASALLPQGRFMEASALLLVGAQNTRIDPKADEYLRLIRSQLQAWELLGYPACEAWPLQAYC